MAHWKQQVDRGIELLELCQKLQSEKDGVDRPALHSFDKSKTLDDFAMDISAAAANMASLHKLFPMMNDLAALGRKLEANGLISPDVGDDYSRSALNYLLDQYSVKTTQ